jgi:DNA-binding transcriptional LysR family regulator
MKFTISMEEQLSRWDGIEEMVAIASAGSFSAAAKTLGLSPAHMSRAIARLEATIQAPVFLRTTRKVHLTDTGKALLDQFRRILDERNDALDSASSLGEPRGALRITCSTALGERFVAPIVRRYAEDHASLRVSIQLSNHLVDLIAEGYDLAIRTGQLADSRLTTTKIASRRLFLAAAPSYLSTHGAPEDLESLVDHQCLIGTASTWHFLHDGREVTLRPSGRWQCNSGAAVADAAVAGLGICQLPEFYVTRFFEEGSLVPLLEGNRPEDEPVWAVYPQRRHLTPKVRLLVEMLRRDLGRAMCGGLTL